jgi:hypothetical protein
MKKKIDKNELFEDIENLRWHMKAYPYESHISNTKRILKIVDQLIDLHKRETKPELYKLHLPK